jgi:hypothetical protein
VSEVGRISSRLRGLLGEVRRLDRQAQHASNVARALATQPVRDERKRGERDAAVARARGALAALTADQRRALAAGNAWLAMHGSSQGGGGGGRGGRGADRSRARSQRNNADRRAAAARRRERRAEAALREAQRREASREMAAEDNRESAAKLAVTALEQILGIPDSGGALADAVAPLARRQVRAYVAMKGRETASRVRAAIGRLRGGGRRSGRGGG